MKQEGDERSVEASKKTRAKPPTFQATFMAYLLSMSNQISHLRRLGKIGSMERGLNTVIRSDLEVKIKKQKS